MDNDITGWKFADYLRAYMTLLNYTVSAKNFFTNLSSRHQQVEKIIETKFL